MADPTTPLERRRTFDATPASVGIARAWAGATLEGLGADERAVNDLVLVVSELASNVVQHDPGRSVTITVDDPPGWWELIVGGSSLPGADPGGWTMAHADDRDGRGLAIVRGLVDEVSVEPATRTIRCRLARP